MKLQHWMLAMRELELLWSELAMPALLSLLRPMRFQ